MNSLNLSTARWPWATLFLSVLFIYGCDSVRNLVDACDETPSTTYLLPVRNLDYTKIGSNYLSNPVNHNVHVCRDHFLPSTPAGMQYGDAIQEINRILGTELHFTSTWTGITHKDPFDLFPTNPTASIFDYVDVNAPMPNKCALPGDLTFAMRLCRHTKNAAGGTDYFTVMARSTLYNHFSDPSSDNYPEKHGILHELAHAYGMNHTGSWATADKDYISTMQGNLEYLSALDVCYLRHKYPETMPEHRNYVASSLTRFNGQKGKFNQDNPTDFYIDEQNNLIDCATGQSPEFAVAWFNTGDLDGEPELCGSNRIFLREKFSASPKTIPIKVWRIATMPYLSQDQWKGQVTVSVDDPTSINFSRDWELVFEVNAYSVLDEVTREDNIITKDVFLHESSPCSSGKNRRFEAERLPIKTLARMATPCGRGS